VYTPKERGRSMKRGARSKAAKRTVVAGASDGKEQRKAMVETAAEKAARVAFLRAGLEESRRYNAMKLKDMKEEYRRAGKLHTYDPDKEMEKRFARVVKLHPFRWADDMVAEIEKCMRYLEEDEDDYRIGLYSFIQE
jgi:hypothetical protein